MDDAEDRSVDDVTDAPASAARDAFTYDDVGELHVDGETFRVCRRRKDGSHHYDWISGPNAGYGFSVSGGVGPVSHDQHLVVARGFLASIDPETGYL